MAAKDASWPNTTSSFDIKTTTDMPIATTYDADRWRKVSEELEQAVANLSVAIARLNQAVKALERSLPPND